MPTLSIQIKGAEMKRKGFENLDANIPVIAAQDIYDAMLRAQTEMKTPGASISYPVKWDSEKQRRAYFATDGFGGGIPTQRSGRYEAAWDIRRNPSPDRAREGYSLYNKLDWAQYVGGNAYGDRQSRIHRDRWNKLAAAVRKAVDGLPGKVREHILILAEKSGLR